MIIYEGPSAFDGSPIVAIVTGYGPNRSANRKTGRMAQLWILRADVAPLAAIRSGSDDAICGTCPLRGTVGDDGKRIGRACYVNVGQAPTSVYRAYVRGSYERVTPADAGQILSGQKVRLGAYGDPAMLPIGVVRDLIAHASLWTGYTHQWRDIDPAWSGLLMASADSVADRRHARELGYRSFYVAPIGTDIATESGVVECAATRARNPLQCDACGMCAGTRNGTRSGAVDVAIIAHGSGAKYVGSDLDSRN